MTDIDVIRERAERLERHFGVPLSDAALDVRDGLLSELAEDVPRLLERVGELEGQLGQALRQWRMYANDDRQSEEDWIENANDGEAELYRAAVKALERP
jgi:hypothetical protein